MTVSQPHFGFYLGFKCFLRFVCLVLLKQNFFIRLFFLETILLVGELLHLKSEMLLRWKHILNWRYVVIWLDSVPLCWKQSLLLCFRCRLARLSTVSQTLILLMIEWVKLGLRICVVRHEKWRMGLELISWWYRSLQRWTHYTVVFVTNLLRQCCTFNSLRKIQAWKTYVWLVLELIDCADPTSPQLWQLLFHSNTLVNKGLVFHFFSLDYSLFRF